VCFSTTALFSAPALLRLRLNLLLLLNLLQMDLLLPVSELLLHPVLGLPPDGRYSPVFYRMTIIKAFLLVPVIAYLPVEPLLTCTNERLPVNAAFNGSLKVRQEKLSKTYLTIQKLYVLYRNRLTES
jgi:hypothetical protein